MQRRAAVVHYGAIVTCPDCAVSSDAVCGRERLDPLPSKQMACQAGKKKAR